MRALFWFIAWCPLALSSPGGRGWGSVWNLFNEALIPLVRASLSWPKHLLKTPPSGSITLGFRIQTYEFWGDIKIQTIVAILLVMFLSSGLIPSVSTPLGLFTSLLRHMPQYRLYIRYLCMSYHLLVLGVFEDRRNLSLLLDMKCQNQSIKLIMKISSM